jgi:signal transduction histidine kinase/CheY-like chemotaxis protein
MRVDDIAVLRQLIILSVLAIAMIASCTSAHADILLLKADSPTVDVLPLGRSLFVAESAPQRAPLSASEFVSSLTPVSQINRLGGKYWLHVRIKNDTDISDWVFDPHNSVIDRIEGFIYHNGSVQALQTGYLQSHDFSLHYGQQFQLAPGAEAQVLIYFESRYFSSQPRFELTPDDSFKHKVLVENSWIMGCIGAMLVLSIYNLFLGVWTKDRCYVYYALYLAFSMLGWSAAFNMWAELLGWYSLNIILLPFFPAIAFNILYYIHFLQLRESSKILTKISYGMVLLCGLFPACYSLMSPGTLFMALSIVTAIWVVMGLVIGIVRLRQGYKPALYFVAAFSVVFVAAILSVLPNLGYEELVSNADLLTLVAQTLDMLLLAMALAHRIRILRDERESALAAKNNADRNTERAIQAQAQMEAMSAESIKLVKALATQQVKSAQLANEAKSTFLATMSHDIRTPINGVMGMLSLLLKAELSQQQRRYALLAKSSSESLLHLINGILDFSKIEAGKLELEQLDFDVERSMGDIAEEMALSAQEKEVELVLDFSCHAESSIVKGDPGRLRQVVVNLVGNAIKFTASGEVVIRAALDSRPEGLVLSCRVTDTGIGIAPEKLDTLFHSFSQADSSTTREYGGTGLGLTIAKNLCEMMSGEINVLSKPGTGSEFSFSVKLGRSDLQQERHAPRLTADSIIVMDDNHAANHALSRQLIEWGRRVTSVYDARDLSKALNTRHEVSMLLVTSGLQADALSALESHGSVNVVVINRLADGIPTESDKSSNITDRLTKPITRANLISFLQYQDQSDGGTQAEKEPESMTLSQTREKDTRVLLVEDNMINREVAMGLLENLGFDVYIAENGEEAVHELTHSELPCGLVLMDCQMPIMDGYEATRQIRSGSAGKMAQDIPIIALTANAMNENKQRCLAAGMSDYLTMPIDPEKLDKILTHWLNRGEAHAHPG